MEIAEIFDKTVREVRDEISHDHDGPVTRFVLIARALDLADLYDRDAISEAIYAELVERGLMSPDDEP
jgi:hypothetical protein